MSTHRKAPNFEQIDIAGPVGRLECLRLAAATEFPHGIALVAHPNPLEGGSFTNKIVHTLAKTLSRLGYICYCPNLRGVGNSEGTHDYGHGEVDDMAAVLAQARTENPHVHRLVLSGFSFGTYVQAQLCQRLGDDAVHDVILVGPATSRYDFPSVPNNTLVIHGEEDEVIPLDSVMNWARPHHLPIVVVPSTGHFFHGRLTRLAEIVARNMHD